MTLLLLGATHRLAHLCSTTNKFGFKRMNIGDLTGGAAPAAPRFQPFWRKSVNPRGMGTESPSKKAFFRINTGEAEWANRH
jgi:hypothetical protein